MTLQQTRVDNQIAQRFKKAARDRVETPYSNLQRKVIEAAAAVPEAWDSHWIRLQAMKLKPARKPLAKLRRESGDR